MERWLKSIHDTVLESHSSEALAEEVGLTRNDLLNRVNPDSDRGWLNLIHYYRLLKTTRDFRSLHALANRFGFQLSAQRQDAPAEPMAVVLMMTSDLGGVATAVTQAMSDDRITPNEEQVIRLEIAELRARADALEAAVSAKAKECRRD